MNGLGPLTTPKLACGMVYDGRAYLNENFRCWFRAGGKGAARNVSPNAKSFPKAEAVVHPHTDGQRPVRVVQHTYHTTSASPSCSIYQPTVSTCPPHLASDRARKVPRTVGNPALAPKGASSGFDDFAGAGPDCGPR
jgi:hypothetical protein